MDEIPGSGKLEGAPLVMGVINVTPDSFSDGGLFFQPGDAIEQGRRLITEGANLLDVGGESTRPGAEPVGAAEELERVEPVIAELAAEGVPLSIDTSKEDVAAGALAAGAGIVNDVTALRADPGIARVCAEASAVLVLMHMQGDPRTMQDDPRYDDVVGDVRAFLEERMAFAVAEGVPEERIWLDPGIGFGKTLDHNLELLRRLPELAAIGRPLVVGTSRKSFIGKIDGSDAAARLGGSVASSVLAYAAGAQVLRVHDVAAVRQGLAVAGAILA